MKILYLEDNLTDADLTNRKLSSVFPNAEMIHAKTLGEAEELISKNSHFDIALIDMHLPDGSGLELILKLKEQQISFPIVVLTGTGDEESAVAVLKAGADDYLTKKTGYLDHLPTSMNQAISNYENKLKIASQKISVLYVEHNKSDIELTERHFKTYAPNFSITAVNTAEEALNILPKSSETPCKFCVILIDYRLTGMNALEFVKIIRQERELKVAIIVVTGQGNEEVAIEALRVGVDEYLVKRPNYLFRLPSLLTSAYQHHLLESNQLALEKSEALYKLLVNNSMDVIFMLDLDLKYTFISPAVFHLRGYHPEEVIGQSITKTLSPESLTIAKGTFEKALNNTPSSQQSLKEPIVLELEMIRKDGSKIWTEVKASPLADEKDNITGIFGVTRDISTRKKAEFDLLKAKEKAEESDQLKTAFLNNISHEIRTPMNAIVGFAEVLNDPDIDEEGRQYFTKIIAKSSHQLLSIVSDIINIATIEAGQEKFNESKVNINSVCELIKDQFSSDFADKKLSLTCQTPLPNHEAEIKTDETKLIQILSNLLNNALKFTPKGKVSFGYNIKDDQIEFYVEDTGIGIPPDKFPIIFDRFRQVETDATREYGGSGLGLSISKAYASLLNGKIWLTSKFGEGSTFYLSIPFIKPSKKTSNRNVQSHPLNLPVENRKTILVAEDEESNFNLIETYLSSQNVNILRTKNGSEAIDICKSNPEIALVLMDIKMPVMNGYEATREIRKFNKDIVIIAQTAYALSGDAEKSINAGCNEHLSKPIKKQELLEVISRHLQL